MTRREVAFVLIGSGLGLLLSLAGILEIFISMQRCETITSYGFDKIVVVIPILVLLTGIVMLTFRSKPDPNSN